MCWILRFIILAFILLTSGVSSYSASTPFKLVVGYAALNARISALWIAEEHGLFAKYGLDAQPVYLRGAPTLVAGLASGDMQLGRSGGSAMLAAISGGYDFKLVATFSSHNTYDLIARPSIKRAEDLRGKTFGITSIGGTTWMGALLWLEHFGLEPQRDKILLQVVGDQSVQAQAVETGTVDAAVLDGVFSRRLKQKGFTVLGEYSDLNQRIVGQAMIAPHTFLLQRPDIVENYLKAEIEALAFALAPKNKPAVLKTLARRLRTDAAGAEDGYQDLLVGVDRKPFASLEGLRNVQRMLKLRTPKVGEIKVDEVVDNRIMRKLDETGFIDRAYAVQGAIIK